MKNLRTSLFSLFAIVSMLFAGSQALAAPAPAETNWTGMYVGGHLGGVAGEFTNAGGVIGPNDTGGNVMGGVQAGYNWQTGRIVVGGEADFSWIPFEATGTPGSFEENWMMTFRGRLGYAMGRFLPYITAGIALTDTESKLAGGGSESNWHTGLAAGGGVEYNCHDNWSLKGEYLYANAPNETATIGVTPFTGGSANHIFRLGVNYRFQ
ncbi:MAG: outer membrane protein [Alphaproteobacteria bacterium]|nr:outer membrane protein [Alphaproteobacteria bacterium]